MATFLKSAYHLADAESFGFEDVGGSFHESSIDALAASGITAGCGTDPPQFCPHDDVTRAEMSTFVGRALRRAAQPEISEHADALAANALAAVRRYTSGPIDIPVYYCAAASAGYTSDGLRAEVGRRCRGENPPFRG